MKLDRFVCYFSEKLAQKKTKKNEKKGNYQDHKCLQCDFMEA
jgi:hypothetical protein